MSILDNASGWICNTANSVVRNGFEAVRHPIATTSSVAQSVNRMYQQLPYAAKVIGTSIAMIGCGLKLQRSVNQLCAASLEPGFEIGFQYSHSYEDFFEEIEVAPYLDRQSCIPGICGTIPLSREVLAYGSSALTTLFPQLREAVGDSGLIGLAVLGGAAATVVHQKLTRTLLPSSEHTDANAWIKALYGASHAPLTQLAGWISIMIGVLTDQVDIGAVSSAYNAAGRDYTWMEGLARAYAFGQPVPIEEFLFRVVLQGAVCTTLVYNLLRLLCSSDTSHRITHHGLSKAFRVLLSAFAFSIFHWQNIVLYSRSQVMMQLFNTFGLGLVCAYLQEQTGDGWGALGLHLAFNMQASLAGR